MGEGEERVGESEGKGEDLSILLAPALTRWDCKPETANLRDGKRGGQKLAGDAAYRWVRRSLLPPFKFTVSKRELQSRHAGSLEPFPGRPRGETTCHRRPGPRSG